MVTRDYEMRMRASTLAANLALAREAASLTQTELANRAGTSRATIAQIESGRGDPRLSTLGAIADALDVSTYLLLLSADDLQQISEVTKRADLSELQPLADQQVMLKQLAESPLSADQRQAARLSGSVVTELGLTSTGAAVGAAIGTMLMPGIGTILGAMIGGKLPKLNDD